MSDESENTTTLSVRDDEDVAHYYPVLRWGRSQFRFPTADCVVTVKETMNVTLDEFTSFMSTGTSPSRSPEKWKKFVTVRNLGMVTVKEGVYPYVMFNVEGHPQMANVVHFLPTEPAAKLLPMLYAEVKEDPEAFGIKIHSAKTAESRAKHQARLDALQWTPSMCMSSQNKTGVVKTTLPNPPFNNWEHVPSKHHVKWCCTPERQRPTSAATKKPSTTGKRKDRDEPPPGAIFMTNPGFGNTNYMCELPVGNSYTTTIHNGRLCVVVYGDLTEYGEGAGEAAGEAGEAAGEAGEAAAAAAAAAAALDDDDDDDDNDDE